MVRPWCVLYILTWKCASRHNGVQLFISHLASCLRTRRFSEPTFPPSRATNHWKNTVNRDFPTFSRICIFFLLTLSLLIFSLLIFSLLTLLTSAFQLSILSEVSLLNFLRLYLYYLTCHRNTFTAPESEFLSCIQVWISDAIRKTLTPRQHRKLTVKKNNSRCSSELVKAWGDSPASYSDSLESNLYSFIISFLSISRFQFLTVRIHSRCPLEASMVYQGPHVAHTMRSTMVP